MTARDAAGGACLAIGSDVMIRDLSRTRAGATCLFVLLWSSGAIFARLGLDHASVFDLLTLRYAVAIAGRRVRGGGAGRDDGRGDPAEVGDPAAARGAAAAVRREPRDVPGVLAVPAAPARADGRAGDRAVVAGDRDLGDRTAIVIPIDPDWQSGRCHESVLSRADRHRDPGSLRVWQRAVGAGRRGDGGDPGRARRGVQSQSAMVARTSATKPRTCVRRSWNTMPLTVRHRPASVSSVQPSTGRCTP